MIKGCQKKIIHVRPGEKSFFEDAFFILKDSDNTSVSGDDIIKEALRIANSSDSMAKKLKKKRFAAAAAVFLAGACAVSVLLAATALIFILLC